MKKSFTPLRNLFTVAILAAVFPAAFVPAASAGVATITFTIQQGNLQTNGVAYGSGSGYSGVVDGQLNDNNAASVLSTTTATNTLGNAFTSGNGRQYVGLFSYNLTELNSFIAANNLSSNAVTIQSASFQLISAGGVTGSAMTLGLYGTDPFTSSATWSNLDGTTSWSNPYQNLTAPANTQQYGYTGGGSALTASLGGTSPNTGIASGSALTWTTSPAFIGAVQNALARADKKLYLTARGTFFSNGDDRLNVNFSPTATVASRPQLTITLQINTSPFTWTGGGGTSWGTPGNWTLGGVPTADSQIIFNSASTANLSTVLNSGYSTTNLIVTTPSGPVSIGGGNTLTLDGSSAIDLSGANQNLTITAPVALGAGQAWNVAANQTLSVNGGISGAFALTNNGPGTLVLGGNDANTSLTVKGGTVSFATDGNTTGNPYPLGAYPASPTAAAVTLNGGGAGLLATSSATIYTNRGISLVSPGGALDASSGQTLTVNSAISGSGALAKGSNSGTVTLNAANASSFTGATTINGGTLAISSSGLLYNTAGGNYGVTVNSGATLSVYAWAYAPLGSIGSDYISAGNLAINGGTITYTGVGEGSGSANNARLFTIGVGGATLDAEGSSTWYLEQNAAYDTNSSGVFIGQNIPSGQTLTLTGSGNGQYDKVLSGSGALAKSGTGTWNLYGSTNTYSGGTTINGGILHPGNTNAIGTGTLTVSSSGTFYPTAAAAMAFTNPVTLNGGTLEMGGGGGHVLSINGPVAVTANSTMTADGGTYGIYVNGGLDMGSGGYTLSSYNNNSSAGSQISGITGANGTIMNIAPNGTLWITGSNTFAGTFRATNGPISFLNVYALQNATLDMNAVDSGAVSFSANVIIGALTGSRNLNLGTRAVSIGNNNADTTYSGGITNSGSVTKIGTGALTLAGTSTYSGATTVSNGALLVNGSIASATTVQSGATLGGSGAISNSLTLVSGAAVTNNQGTPLTVTGALIANGNIMNVSTPSALGNGDYTLMTYNSGSSGLFSSTPVISGAGLVTGGVGTIVTGGGTVTLHVTGGTGSSPTITNQFSGGNLTLTWANTGWYAQSNSVGLTSSSSWHDVPSSQSGTSLIITVNPAKPQVFYRLSNTSQP